MSFQDHEAVLEKDNTSSTIPTPPQDLYPNNIVTFSGPSDPELPLNWPARKKVLTTLFYGITTAGNTWASSVYSPATNAIAIEFNVSTEISILGMTLFLFGFGLGPLL